MTIYRKMINLLWINNNSKYLCTRYHSFWIHKANFDRIKGESNRTVVKSMSVSYIASYSTRPWNQSPTHHANALPPSYIPSLRVLLSVTNEIAYQEENWLENDVNITVDHEPNKASLYNNRLHISQDKFFKTDHMIYHKVSLNKFKNICNA